MERGERVVIGLTAAWTLFNVGVIVAVLAFAVPGGPSPLPQPTPAVPRTPAAAKGLAPDELRILGLDVLPPVTMPPDNPLTDEKAELGALLFFDRRMSGDGVVSCATCHAPNKGWGDGNALSLGYPGTLHWRNSQTVINAVYLQKLFWAGEALGLEAQAKSAWTGNLAGNLDPSMAEAQLRQMPGYVRRFKEVFGSEAPSFGDALRAIAAFEATITSRNVPFDLYMKGDETALSDAALRGLDLFVGKAGCVQCHSGPLFTDQSYHNLGVPPHPEFETNPLRQIALRYQHRARGVSESEYRRADRDLGLFYTTKREEDRGKFRTPPLRELGQTGPYMHNGVLETLTEVVEFYDRGGGDDSNRDPLLRPLGLAEREISDLVAFLESLTGDPIIVEPPPMPEYEVLP